MLGYLYVYIYVGILEYDVILVDFVLKPSWNLNSTQVKEGGVAQHVEGWRDMHFKGSSGAVMLTDFCKTINICLSYVFNLNKAKSTSGGDDTPVDEVEVLERSLGQGCRHVRDVGKIVKSITPYLTPHMYAPAANELQQQRINEMMQQQINKLILMQGGQGSSSHYYPRFEQNEDQDEDDDSD
ncbi:hypothetical protein R6Q57_000679 [Mikania cordata]